MDGASKAELRKKGLCYFCKTKWESGHKCMGKGQLHLIEYTPLEDDSEGEEGKSDDANFAQLEMDQPLQSQRLIVENDGEGTLATISGKSQFMTIKVVGKLGNDDVVVFIDGEATHSFIDDDFVAKKGLKSEKNSGFNVKNTNGVISMCDQVVRQVKIQFMDYSLVNDFYVF